MSVRLLVLLALLVPAPVRGEPDPRIAAEASAHFEAGVALVKRGNHAAALTELEKAYALVPHWGFLFNIGITQRTLFRYGAAIRTLERYLAEGAGDVPADRRTKVEAELADLRKLVGELAITVEGGPARVVVGQEHDADTPLAAPVLVAPGTHTITATRGEATDRRTITIVAGERLAIRLDPKAVAIKKAKLTVTARPAAARIRIDGGPFTTAPWAGELDAGGHRITAELAGHRTEATEIRLDPGQDRALAIDLVALPATEQRPWYRRPLVWIAIGVGVAATTGGVAYLARPEGPDVALRWP